MRSTITIHYPIGGDSPLTGQTRQALSLNLYKLLRKGVLSTVRQDYTPNNGQNGGTNFAHGVYTLALTPNIGIETKYVRSEVEKLLAPHRGATIHP
ncbi:hypothetical protein KBC86_01230 [Candidatus Gracilibacteria bacterium]|nr:hypothetical protein [Candidatus Gracilibacteria bacterium]